MTSEADHYNVKFAKSSLGGKTPWHVSSSERMSFNEIDDGFLGQVLQKFL